MKNIAIALLFVAAVPVLTGCGGDNDAAVVLPPPSPPVVVTPPPDPAPTNATPDDFGAGFAAAFRAGADAQPVDPVAGDVIAVNKFGNPLDVTNPN